MNLFVIPEYKKEDKSLVGCYRSIAIIPVIAKVFETIVKVQLIDHIEANNLFCKTQHGFRRGHRLSQQSCAPG